MIVVVDYGMGNSGSILNIISRIGAEAILSSKASEINTAEKLVLPGVGAFDRGMDQLRGLGLVDALNEKVLVKKTPILGICLGMQLFMKGSEEGDSEGLCWIDGHSIRFRCDPPYENLKIPHMGWNTLELCKPTSIFDDTDPEMRFYFVHSYHVECADRSDVLTTTRYGIDFVSAVKKDSILGVQFHPEKSLRWGIQVFRKFVQNG
jgi:glutamine amidotransferase